MLLSLKLPFPSLLRVLLLVMARFLLYPSFCFILWIYAYPIYFLNTFALFRLVLLPEWLCTGVLLDFGGGGGGNNDVFLTGGARGVSILLIKCVDCVWGGFYSLEIFNSFFFISMFFLFKLRSFWLILTFYRKKSLLSDLCILLSFNYCFICS